MDNKLQAIIAKIERSTLTDAEKEELYAAISEGLHATVLPVLLEYMPQDQVRGIVNNPETITVDRYVELVGEAVKDKAVMPKISKKMDALLVEVNRLLANEGIV
jgi:hypothetical protein